MKIQETIPNDFSTRNLVRTRSIQPEEKRTRELSTSEKLMEELRNNYKNIQFDFVDFKNDSQLKEYAMSKPGMNHVAISKELLNKMAEDEKQYTEVKEILSSLSKYQENSMIEAYLSGKKLNGMGLVLDENGEVSKWTNMEEIPEETYWIPKHETGSTTSSFSSTTEKKNIYEIPYKYSQSRHMMRLANAKNVTSVRGVIAASQSEIGKVKLKISDPKEAAVIIRKIKNVIRNGNIKIARLHKEERLFRAERLAEKRKKAALDRQLAEQLRKKKIARKAQEHCQTASFDDIFGKPSVNDERYRQISEQYASVAALGVGAASVSASASAVTTVPQTALTGGSGGEISIVSTGVINSSV